MLFIHEKAKQEMVSDALQTFPDECCGFVFGDEEEEERIITAIQPVQNAREGDKRRKFEISPRDYLKAERFAEENHLALLGVYHSHPGHPAIPSEQDREAAQPYFSYIILSVKEKVFENWRSWKLNELNRFEEEKIIETALEFE